MKKFTKAKQILAALAGGTLATLEVLDEISFTKGSVYRNKRRARSVQDFDVLELQRFYSMLTRLKRDGLVLKRKTANGVFWKITSFGLNKLKVLEENNTKYKSESDGRVKIIIFDIPEKDRKKRAWLREVLKILNFKILQQSVWIGKNKIPEEFLFDLHQKNLVSFIHILEVTKSGTIKELA